MGSLMRSKICVLLAVLAAASISGCAKARFVEITPQGGVVAIPSNSNSWPNYYRDKAEELIKKKCPDGYEIVMEEEYVKGQVAHTHSRSKTREAPSLGIGGVQDDAEAGKNRSASFAGLSIPLGKTEEETNETTNFTDVTEYRIHFRPKPL